MASKNIEDDKRAHETDDSTEIIRAPPSPGRSEPYATINADLPGALEDAMNNYYSSNALNRRSIYKINFQTIHPPSPASATEAGHHRRVENRIITFTFVTKNPTFRTVLSDTLRLCVICPYLCGLAARAGFNMLCKCYRSSNQDQGSGAAGRQSNTD